MAYRIGVDMGGTSIKAGVVDENFRIISSLERPTGSTFEQVVADMAECAKAAAASVGQDIAAFPGVGVGTPSCINPNTGRLVFSNNTNWRDVPLREELEKHLPVPVWCGNDANCAVIGEALAGAAKGCDNVLMITLGTGVGGGLIFGGKLFVGGDGMGGELGHTPLITGGVPCTCGVAGCLEAYASVTGLIREAKEALAENPQSLLGKETLTGRYIVDCARAGDPTAVQVFDQYTGYVANGLGGMITVFRPEIVLIGGGLSGAGDFLLDPINEKLPKFVFSSDIIGVPPVVTAALGNSAGTIGAAYLDRM